MGVRRDSQLRESIWIRLQELGEVKEWAKKGSRDGRGSKEHEFFSSLCSIL
jgi:hypothetical protein